jgi:uncharacterized membrane protein
MTTIKDRVVEGLVKVRTSFAYVWLAIGLPILWVLIHRLGFVSWDNYDLTYLNLTLSIMAEVQGVVLLIYTSQIAERQRDHHRKEQEHHQRQDRSREALLGKLKDIQSAIDELEDDVDEVEHDLREDYDMSNGKHKHQGPTQGPNHQPLPDDGSGAPDPNVLVGAQLDALKALWAGWTDPQRAAFVSSGSALAFRNVQALGLSNQDINDYSTGYAKGNWTMDDANKVAQDLAAAGLVQPAPTGHPAHEAHAAARAAAQGTATVS